MSSSSKFRNVHFDQFASAPARRCFGHEAGKRIFDFLLSLPALIVISPVLLLLAIWIKFDSPGPVLYRGLRGGRFGKPFRIYKFRTMGAEAEKLGGTDTAADDPRITRAGRFLRRYKLDEFPQLLNVIKGEMSLVGPRPLPLQEVLLHNERERELLLVKPGITDWASVKFRWEEELLRGSADPHRAHEERVRPEKIKLALEYVHNHSLLTDCQIILATLRAIITPPPNIPASPPAELAPHIAVSGSTLAIDGGTPVRSQPFAPWPCLGEDEIAAALAVLRSGKINYWTGTEGAQFEREFGSFTARKHAVAVANGTVALELALRVLKIGPGDEVIVPSRTFIASASCAVMVGATPIIVDVDRVSQTISVDTIRPALSPRTRAIIAVHLAGWPCDMDPILAVAREHNVRVIEDCAQAHGATYKGRVVGSMGDVAAFSFCQDKIISTGGEGGMLVTDNDELCHAAWSFKDHGKSYEAAHQTHNGATFRWLHESFGTNWRMTELQSAIGRVVLRKIHTQGALRRRNAALLTKHFSEIPALRVTVPPSGIGHSYYKYYVFLRPEMLHEGWDRERTVSAICGEGVPCSSGACSEIYLEKAFPREMRPRERLAIARELGETSLMFLVHPTLSEQDMRDTVNAVAKVLAAATRSPFAQIGFSISRARGASATV
jgi:dTDP-4-amino-4,6-dideoxygalactose transaminase/lipopolysaccharide/colanic/teichoic acid biosynthesis glycosyltransferase